MVCIHKQPYCLEKTRPPPHPLRSKPLHQRGSEPETSSISSTPSGDTYVKFTKSGQESSDQNGHSEGSKVVGQLDEIQTLLSDIVNRLGTFEERQSNFEADLRELKAAAPNRDAEGIIINSSMSPAEVCRLRELQMYSYSVADPG